MWKMKLKIGQFTLCYKHIVKFSVAVYVSGCSACVFFATEGTVHLASQLPLSIAWRDSNIMFHSWYVCLSYEEET
jgi:hypothetical protein